MISRPYLIRIATGGLEGWYVDQPKTDALTKSAFKLSDTEHSVYEVRSSEDECLAVAAHALTNIANRPDAATVIRIDRNELQSLGIDIAEDELGTTGIPRWDLRHRNLIANPEKIASLIKLLLTRIQCGDDRVRRIYGMPLKYALRSLGEAPNKFCPKHVKAIINWIQLSDKPDLPRFLLKEIEGEIAEIEFDDEVIRPLASKRGSGDSLRDWHEVTNEVRSTYAKQYLREVARRFRLQ